MRIHFEEQVKRLHVELIKMGSLCEEAISLSAKSLETPGKYFYDKVKELEIAIDQQENEIESICMRLLLQQQPVARDLRNISSALKMISDMERIGDQAVDITEIAPFISQSQPKSKVHLADMARIVVSMVTDSIEAFVKKDLTLAQHVMKTDDEVDALFDRVKEEITDLIAQKDTDGVLPVDLLMAAKYFERIGDHAVNIAEWVEYSITGEHKK